MNCVFMRMYNRNAEMRKYNNAKKRKCNNAKMLLCEKAKMRSDTLSSLCVFAFLYFECEKAKIRQMECEYTTDFMCCIFALLLSNFCFFASKMRKNENTTKSNFVVPTCFRILRLRSEYATWRKSDTID
jgi:hypothetical protein